MRSRHLTALLLLALGLSCTAEPRTAASAAGGHRRPEITTSETFDAKQVAPYAGAHDATYAYTTRTSGRTSRTSRVGPAWA